MKASELRIGNWIRDLDDGDEYQVIEITKGGFVAGPLTVYPAGMELFDYGIPLTSEWLEKFPTYRIKAGRHYGFQQAFYQIELAGENLGWRMILREGHYIGDYIKCVHQLQNLYFALTGTELEFKER